MDINTRSNKNESDLPVKDGSTIYMLQWNLVECNIDGKVTKADKHTHCFRNFENMLMEYRHLKDQPLVRNIEIYKATFNEIMNVKIEKILDLA